MTIAPYTFEGRTAHYRGGGKGHPSRRPSAVRNLNAEHDQASSFGQRLADRVAAVGGSWGFIIGFGVGLFAWTLGNSLLLGSRAFDPYPYIFLNLVLSMLAAIQAPIIMMSQNRAAERDRRAAELDYEVNVKAEAEIMAIHARMDREIIGLHLKIDTILRAQGLDPDAIIAPLLADAASHGAGK